MQSAYKHVLAIKAPCCDAFAIINHLARSLKNDFTAHTSSPLPHMPYSVHNMNKANTMVMVHNMHHYHRIRSRSSMWLSPTSLYLRFWVISWHVTLACCVNGTLLAVTLCTTGSGSWRARQGNGKFLPTSFRKAQAIGRWKSREGLRSGWRAGACEVRRNMGWEGRRFELRSGIWWSG